MQYRNHSSLTPILKLGFDSYRLGGPGPGLFHKEYPSLDLDLDLTFNQHLMHDCKSLENREVYCVRLAAFRYGRDLALVVVFKGPAADGPFERMVLFWF